MKKNNVTIREVYDLVEKFRNEVKDNYVTQNEFKPVRAVVFGLVGLILAGAFTAMLANVIRANL